MALDQQPTEINQNATKHQRGSKSAPVFIKKLATDEEKTAGYKEETERKKKWEMDVDTLKVAKEAKIASEDAANYAGYGVFVSLLLAGIAFLQWCMFKKQLFLMRASNRLTMKSAIASELAAKSALENVRLAEKQFIASHRPWIKVDLNHTKHSVINNVA